MLKIMTTLLFASSISLAASARSLEAGTYQATDVDSGTIEATILVRADQSLVFNISTPDFTMPAPGCVGKFSASRQDVVSADLTCPVEAFSKIHMDINIANVTPESVRSAQGALVAVVLDAVGPDPIEFVLKKVK